MSSIESCTRMLTSARPSSVSTNWTARSYTSTASRRRSRAFGKPASPPYVRPVRVAMYGLVV